MKKHQEKESNIEKQLQDIRDDLIASISYSISNLFDISNKEGGFSIADLLMCRYHCMR